MEIVFDTCSGKMKKTMYVTNYIALIKIICELFLKFKEFETNN